MLIVFALVDVDPDPGLVLPPLVAVVQDVADLRLGPSVKELHEDTASHAMTVADDAVVDLDSSDVSDDSSGYGSYVLVRGSSGEVSGDADGAKDLVLVFLFFLFFINLFLFQV
jgi:hypothetical protein